MNTRLHKKHVYCVRHARRGFSALIVLLLIAVTLSLSYASMRSQSVNARIQRNASSRVCARSAALAGLTLGLKVMHTDDWQGVDTELKGVLSPYETFTVEFKTGDGSIEDDSVTHLQSALRVTLTSEGRARDPNNPKRVTTHTEKAVVELIPAWNPFEQDCKWPRLNDFTSYQLYPGGKTYKVVEVGAELSSETPLKPCSDNPAGLFARSGTITLRNGADVKGSLFTRRNSILLDGDNIKVEALKLWPLLDLPDEQVQLPSLVSSDDITVSSDSKATLKGLIVAEHGFYANENGITIEGVVCAKETEPALDGIITLPSPPVRYIYHTPDQPIYAPHPDGGGLRWNVVRWTMNP